jgi:hypothetical protein
MASARYEPSDRLHLWLLTRPQQAVPNRRRFPPDFMFQLTAEELAALRSQIATSKTNPSGSGGRRYLPLAFTEHGAIQAAKCSQQFARH